METEKARGDGEAKNSWKNNQLNYAQLGRQIKKYRIQKKLRQKDLASLVFTTTNTISRLEIGSVGCSLEMLLSISNVLEVSPDVLLFGNFNPMFSRFYPFFWEMKDAISGKIEESLGEIFQNLDEKERLSSVEQDFRDWISAFSVAERGGTEKKDQEEKCSLQEKAGKEKSYLYPADAFFFPKKGMEEKQERMNRKEAKEERRKEVRQRIRVKKEEKE